MLSRRARASRSASVKAGWIVASAADRAAGIRPPWARRTSLLHSDEQPGLLVAERLANGVVARRLHIWPHTANTFGRMGIMGQLFTDTAKSNRVGLWTD
jgi:hypothetical protein